MPSFWFPATWIFFWLVGQFAESRSIQHPFLSDDHALSSLIRNKNAFVVRKVFPFDIKVNFDCHMRIEEDINPSSFSGGIKGDVKIVRGDEDQQHAYLIFVQASSSTSEAFSHLSIQNTTYTVLINSTTLPESADALEIQLDIIFFVKPRAYESFCPTSIGTRNLDITVWPDLQFETRRLTLSTHYGSITSATNTPLFTAHSISLFSAYGSITGTWSFPSSMDLNAGTNINISLIPKRWSSGPNTQGDLAASSKSGNITISTPIEIDTLSLRNYTTFVSAPNGSISGTFVHGFITDLRAGHSIHVTLQPYWAYYSWKWLPGPYYNFITTDSQDGNTDVEVLNPVIDTYYKINPLFRAISRHFQGANPGARMKLSYPGQWSGNATGVGERVNVTGDDFEIIEVTKGMVKVQRATRNGSDLYFESGAGSSELQLKPCSLECLWPQQLLS